MANYNRPLSPGSKLRRGPAGPVPLGLPKKPSGKITKEDIKKIQPKGPMPGTTKKAPATGMKTTAKKAAAKPVVKTTPKTTTKAPAKKKVVQMPSKINPFKMTPAQKAEYLKNPERYDK